MKLKILLGLLVVLVMMGCDDGRYPLIETREIWENVCHDSTIDKRAKYIIDCLNAANPKSDEEPEDWMYICKNQADDLFCKRKTVKKTLRSNCNGCGWTVISVDENIL